VSRVVASKTGEGAALLAFDGHRGDDNSVYVFATSDYGENWKAIRNGIPDSAGSVHVVREHPRNMNLLFAGTEFGLWVSWDRGGNWTALKNNLPTVPVDDIEIQSRENDLVLATHGRSIWVLDDLTPMEKMDASVAGSPLTFFAPRAATTWHLRNRRWSAGQKMFTAKNPPYGAILSYYLKEAVPPETPKNDKEEKDKKDAADEKSKPEAKGDRTEKKEGQVKITVLDKDGKMLRELDGPGANGRQPHQLGSALGSAGGSHTRTAGSDCGGIWIGATRTARRAGGIHHQDQGRRPGSLRESPGRRGYARRYFRGGPRRSARND